MIACILIEMCSKRSGPPIFRIFWRFLACIWACSPVGCFFFAGSYVLPSLSDLKLANQENRGIDQHRSWGGISSAVWGQCCNRACIYYGLYHFRSRAARAAGGHVASAFNSGNFVFLLRPEALLGPGFQMSFVATGLLIIVFNAMSQWTWVARW